MAKGVKKIKCTDGLIYPKMSVPNKSLTIVPDQFVTFQVGEWEAGTTEVEKKKSITWMRQNKSRKIILNQLPSTGGFKLKLPKKLSGPYQYYIEASLSGKPDSRDTGLYVSAYCEPKIVTSKWCTSKDGTDQRSNYFKYGHLVYLGLETEGLNGVQNLTVEVYKVVEGGGGATDDKHIHTYTNVEVIDGEVNLKMGNTANWFVYAKKDIETFYVKVKANNRYITDGKDAIHARFLRMKKDLVTKAIEPSANQTPLKIDKADVKATRYEPCKFDLIKIKDTDNEKKPITIAVFEGEKNKIEKKANPKETERQSIYFDFDKDSIETSSEQSLSNILQFLLEHPYSTMRLNGYACVIGKQNHNNKLSQQRADAVKKFFANGKLDTTRIISKGHGEVNATDDKKGRDNIKYKDEKEYKNNRRVDIEFDYFGHVGQVVYETVAPSSSKNITIEVIGYDTKKCFKSKDPHKKGIKVNSIHYTSFKEVKEASSISIPVHSDLSAINAAPLQYIWPKYNLIKGATGNGIDSAALYYAHIHSCRWFTDNKSVNLLVKAYPDIKWTLEFFLNLTNDLSVGWQNLDPKKHKDWQSKAGKIGAEKRWKQKDVSIGFSLKAKWNNDKQEKELKYEYEAKFKKLYDLFASVGALSDGITNKTKGTARSISPKGIPVAIAVKPPNLKFTGDWFLSHPKGNNHIIGTDVTIGLHAKPLIGLDITIDLLGAVIFGVGSIVGAGPGVTELYKKIQGQLKKGIEVGNEKNGLKANIDLYMDLIISNTISLDAEFKFNTVGKAKDSKFEIKAENKLKVELKVGVKIKGEAVIVVIKVEAYFEASAAGNASVTFGHGINYDEKGLYYRPKLGFDGLNAEYLVEISANLAIEIVKDKHKVKESRGGKHEIAKGEYKNIIPPFDVIEELEKLFGMSANIPLIKND